MADAQRVQPERKKILTEKDIQYSQEVTQFYYRNQGSNAFVKKCLELALERGIKIVDRDLAIEAIIATQTEIDYWKNPTKLSNFFKHNAQQDAPAGPWNEKFRAFMQKRGNITDFPHDYETLKAELLHEHRLRVASKIPTVRTNGWTVDKDPSLKGKEKKAPGPDDDVVYVPLTDDDARRFSGGSSKSSAAAPKTSKKSGSTHGEGSMENPLAKKKKPAETYQEAEEETMDQVVTPSRLFIRHMGDGMPPAYMIVPKNDPQYAEIGRQIKGLGYICFQKALMAVGTEGPYLTFASTLWIDHSTEGKNVFKSAPIDHPLCFVQNDTPSELDKYQIPSQVLEARITRLQAFLQDIDLEAKGEALSDYWEDSKEEEFLVAYTEWKSENNFRKETWSRILASMHHNNFPEMWVMDDIFGDVSMLIEKRIIEPYQFQDELLDQRKRIEANAGFKEGQLVNRQEMAAILDVFVKYEKKYTREMQKAYLDKRDELIRTAGRLGTGDFLESFEEINGHSFQKHFDEMPGIWFSIKNAYDLCVKQMKDQPPKDAPTQKDREREEAEKKAAEEKQKLEAELKARDEMIAQLQQQLAAQGNIQASVQDDNAQGAAGSAGRAAGGKSRPRTRGHSPVPENLAPVEKKRKSNPPDMHKPHAKK